MCIPAGPWQLHLIHVISICPWDGSDKYCRCSLALVPTAVSRLLFPSPLSRDRPSERNCSRKRQRNEGVMRTQPGRCSYCFKADRFIYCPNNLVEFSWPFAVLNRALLTLTRGTPCISFSRCSCQNFTPVVIHLTWHRWVTIIYITARKNDLKKFCIQENEHTHTHTIDIKSSWFWQEIGIYSY